MWYCPIWMDYLLHCVWGDNLMVLMTCVKITEL